MLVLNIGWFIVLFIVVFLLPGLLIVRRFARKADFLENVVLGTGIGICLVSLLSFSAAMFFNIYLSRWVVFAAAAVIIILLFKLLPSVRLRPGRKEILVLAISLLILLVFLVRYNQTSFDYYCVNQDTRNLVFGINMEGGNFSREVANHGLLYKENDVRYGALAVVSTFVSVFDWFGFRLVYAAMIVLIALLSFLIIKRLFQSFALAVVSLLFVLLPPLFNIPTIDENVIALMISMLIIYLLIKKAHYWLVGAIFGLLVGVRHIGVLFVIPLLFWIYFERKRAASFFIAAGIASLPWIIHHKLAFGSVFVHETMRQFGSYPHRFMWWSFNFNGLLNYPFFEQIIRTPYTAFPTFLLFPATLISQLGLILVAVILIGVIYTMQKRRIGIFLILWFVPIYLLLAFQENWLQPNKMNFIIIIFGPLLIWLAAGIKWLISDYRNKLKFFLLIFFILLGGVFAYAIHLVDIPADQRFYEEYPSLVRESAGVYSLEKGKYRVNLLPEFRKGEFDIEGFVYSIRRPKVNILSYPEKEVKAEGDAGIKIDLSKPLIHSDGFIEFSEVADIELIEDAAYLIQNLELGWYDYPVNALLIKNRFNEVILYLGYDENSYFPIDPLSKARRGKDIGEISDIAVESPQLRLRIPRNARIIIIMRLAKEETIYYTRTARIKDSGFIIEKAEKMRNLIK